MIKIFVAGVEEWAQSKNRYPACDLPTQPPETLQCYSAFIVPASISIPISTHEFHSHEGVPKTYSGDPNFVWQPKPLLDHQRDTLRMSQMWEEGLKL